MFKGFQGGYQSTNKKMFNGFPLLNFQQADSAYGFAGCVFWLDASQGLDTQTDGGNVNRWVEKINGIIFSKTAGTPVLTLNDADFNNLPTVSIPTNAYFDSNNPFGFARDSVLVIVYRKNGGVVQYNALFSPTLSVPTISNASSTKLGVFSGTSNEVMTATIGIDSASHILILTKDKIFYDGVEQTVTGSWRLDIAWTALSGAGSSTNRGLNGSIAEILSFNNPLTSEQCIALSDALNAKYNIY